MRGTPVVSFFFVEMTFPMTASVKCATERILFEKRRLHIGEFSFSGVRAGVEEVQAHPEKFRFGQNLG